MFYWKTFDVQNGSLCFNAYLIQKAWLGGFGSCKKDQSALKNKTNKKQVLLPMKIKDFQLQVAET